MILTSELTDKISTAMLQFQGAVSGVKRDGANPHFRSKYVTLENVIDTSRPALQECGIVLVQAPGSIIDGSLEITTRLMHAPSGQWMESTMHMPLGKKDPQGAGSATTYGLRYSLMAMLGLPPTDDDDGNAAMPKLRDNLKINKQTGRTSANSLKQDKSPDNWDAFEQELSECQNVSDLTKLALSWSTISERDVWPTKWHTLARNKINERKEELINGVVPDYETLDDEHERPNSYVDNVSAE